MRLPWVLSLQSLRDFEAAPEATHAWSLERARRFLDLAVEIGAPLLIVCANTLADPEAAADLTVLAEMAAERGLRVGYEALSTSHAVRTYGEAWRIIEKAGRPNLVLGAVHIFATGADFTVLQSIDPKRIFLVHLAEALAATLKAEDPRLDITAAADPAAAAADASGVINCTPVGMVGYDGTPLPRELMAGASWAFDAVYTPIATQFLKDAKA
jgi:sugar phosphate isomerase/epimerase